MKQTLEHLMHKLFRGRRDTWAVRRGNEYFRVFGKEMTDEEYRQHLAGQTMGIYPLLKTGETCRVAAIDIDTDNLELVRTTSQKLPKPNYIERSRSGFYHIWMFFEEPVAIESLETACRKTLTTLRQETDQHCNLYPLQAKGIGLLIALPLQYGYVKQNLSVFIEAESNLQAQFQFLQQIKYTKPPGSFLDNKHLKALWQGKGKKTGDKSASGYDFSFCVALFNAGYSKYNTTRLLSKRPELHQDTPEYIQQTVEAAFVTTQKKTNILPEAAAIVKKVVDWGNIEPLSRDEFLTRLKKCLILHKEQLQQFDIFFAALMANLKTKGRPVWLLFVGPPGCGKTLPMMAIQHAPYVYMTSAFRPTALISGFGIKGGEDQSLIPKLDGKILLVKDMSSFLSQHKEVVAEALGLLRDAYDGACSRQFGTGVERSYTSRFGFLGATTPDIDAHWALNVRLGERFLRHRCRATPEQIYEKIDCAMDNLFEEDKADTEIQDLCMAFFKYLMSEEETENGDGKHKKPYLSNAKVIGRLAQLGAILRTVIARSTFGKEVLVIPEWEEATRYTKQLAKMALGLAYVRGKETNDDEELEDLKSLIRDGMDARIERICRIIYASPGLEAFAIAEKICLPTWTVRSCLDDLAVARVVYYKRNDLSLSWFFIPWLAGQINQFKLWPKGEEK